MSRLQTTQSPHFIIHTMCLTSEPLQSSFGTSTCHVGTVRPVRRCSQLRSKERARCLPDAFKRGKSNSAGFHQRRRCSIDHFPRPCIIQFVTMQVLGHGCSYSSRPRLGKPCRQQQVSLTHTCSRRRQLVCASRTHVNGSRTCKDIMEASTSETKSSFSYRSVFISDLHLGTPQSQAHVLLPFLQQVMICGAMRNLSVRQSFP